MDTEQNATRRGVAITSTSTSIVAIKTPERVYERTSTANFLLAMERSRVTSIEITLVLYEYRFSTVHVHKSRRDFTDFWPISDLHTLNGFFFSFPFHL